VTGGSPLGKIVVLGVGNLLLCDEGVGPRTIEYLDRHWDLGPQVELIDGATAGVELMTLFAGVDHLVVVDTVLGEAEAGAIYRFRPEEVPVGVRYRSSVHQAHFLDALGLAALVGHVPEVIVVGVQPADMETPQVGLTAALEERLPVVAEVVLEELARLGVQPAARG
jgi:hydrogenase maturation protease